MEAEEAGSATSSKPERKQLSADTVEKRREALTKAFKLHVDQQMENVEKECEQRRQRRMRLLEKELLQCNVKGWRMTSISRMKLHS